MQQVQNAVLVQYESWRGQVELGKASVQTSLEDMSRRFNELRTHLENQAQARQHDIDQIRRYNQKLHVMSGAHFT
jgi:hypothetical protein